MSKGKFSEKKKIRVLMLNYEFPPLGGGAGMSTAYLLREFSRDKTLKIDFVTSSVGKYRTDKYSENISMHYLDIYKDPKTLHYQTSRDLLMFSLKSVFYCRGLIKRNTYDIVHAFFGVPCGFIAMLLGVPYIVSLRGSDVPFHNPRFRWLDKFIFAWLSKIVWKRSAFVIANAETLLESAHKIEPDLDIHLIYNGVDTNEYQPNRTKKEYTTVRLLYIGRLSEVKGVMYLLEAFRIINERYKDKEIELWLVGEGKLKDELRRISGKKTYRNKIKFFNRVPTKEIPAIYRKCDCFVLPSLNEGMPLVLLEAMACGLPIICTDMPSLRIFVEDGVNGYIVKKKSAVDIALALEKYINEDESLRTRHGEISREKVQNYTWESSAGQYKSFYERVNGRSKNAV